MASTATLVNSSWVECIGLKDDRLFIEYKQYPGRGKICCLYPNCGPTFYDLCRAWASKGKFVHRFLYRLFPYRIIRCPCAEILGGGGITWSDTFTDPDATPLVAHAPDVGNGGYTPAPTTLGNTMGVLEIANDTLIADSFGNAFVSQGAVAHFDPGLATSTTTFDFTLPVPGGIGDGVVLFVRYAPNTGSDSDGFIVRVQQANITLWQLDDSALTQLDTQSLSLMGGSPYELQVVVTSSGIVATVDGISVNATSATYNTNTKMAIGIVASMIPDDTLIDNLIVE